ncbi:MAG: alpha/beta hydrolase [Melioribacter sp.]|nr:alpha/beta hydrolase [Melioribacter sp.]
MQFPELNYNFDYSITQLDERISVAYYDTVIGNNTLIFIHGLSSYIPAWLKLIPLLQNKLRCIAIDLPGYGKSSEGVHEGTVTFYTEVLSLFIRKLKLENVTLVGHSMGGQISIASALQFPSLISRLVLLAPAGFETFSEKEKSLIKKYNTAQLYYSASEDDILASFRSNFFKMNDDIKPMIDDRINMRRWKNFVDYCNVVVNSLNGLLDYPVYDKLKELMQPSLIFFGKNDKWIPNKNLHKNTTTESIALNGASQIPNSKLILIDECGHFIPYEHPHLLGREIKSFML